MEHALQSAHGLAIAELPRIGDMTDASNQKLGSRHSVIRAAVAFIFCFTLGAIHPAGAADLVANVDALRIVAAAPYPANCITYHPTETQQLFPPPDPIPSCH